MPDTEGSQIGLGFDVMIDEPAAEDANDVLRDVSKAKTDVAAAPIRANNFGFEQGNPEVRSVDDDHPESPESGLRVGGIPDSDV